MTHVSTDSNKTPILNNVTYDFLNNVVQLGLPGVGAFYSALALLWGFPNAEEVVGTCVALALFLGIILKISNASYNKTIADKAGVIDAYVTADGTDLALTKLNLTPEEISGKNLITLKVNTINTPTDSQ